MNIWIHFDYWCENKTIYTNNNIIYYMYIIIYVKIISVAVSIYLNSCRP